MKIVKMLVESVVAYDAGLRGRLMLTAWKAPSCDGSDITLL
jgi:hypothetical protein